MSKREDTVVVGIEGHLLAGNRHELQQAVHDELRRGERWFEIDFRRSDYIDSAGLGVLVAISAKVRKAGGEVRLANLNEDLKALFELTKLDSLFRIDGSRGLAEGRTAARAPSVPAAPRGTVPEHRPEDGPRA